VSDADRLEELQESAAAIGDLAAQPELFRAAVEAFRADDPERFQDALGRANLIDRCEWICRWLCSKHCVLVCGRLVGSIPLDAQFDVEEWRAFGEYTGGLRSDPDTLTRLLDMVAAEDADAFRRFVADAKIERFAHQLCHWLCGVRCRLACRRLCPPRPQLIKVAEIPVGQIDLVGYGSGPSSPGSFTPPDNPAAGVGDHPFGGSVHLNGLLAIAGATEYKVEFGPSPGGPWTAITTPIEDSHDFGFTKYVRTASGDWYSVGDMDTLSEGHTYLTDWSTPPPERNDLHYVRLVVRNAALTEFPGVPVPVRVDNGDPVGPAPGNRPLIEFSQGGKPLDCCSTVRREDGPVNIHIEGTDENFSRLDITAYGGCSASIGIYTKTYNGNRNDTGAPTPGIDVSWDPWAADVQPCCYVVFVTLYDRAIVNNSWNGGHTFNNWRSITVA
jgi:hypothetical protein